jgi:hypothetical protein
MEQSRLPRPFNQPLELGLRALYVLDALAPEKADIQKLLFLDYILVHSSDVQNGPVSLHAAVPYRTGEWLAHHGSLQQGLAMFAAKELLVKEFSSDGILYSASELTKPFISHLKSAYSSVLTKRAAWLVIEYGRSTTEELSVFMLSNLTVWGSEVKSQRPIGSQFISDASDWI